MHKRTLWSLLEAEASAAFLNDQTSETQRQYHFSGISLDASHQKITTSILNLLIQLANASQLKNKIQEMFLGSCINYTAGIPALHTALRAPEQTSIVLDGQDIIAHIVSARKKMFEIVESIRTQTWLGYSGKTITSIVHIGIGGSDFGPKLCLEALSPYAAKNLSYFFISDADPLSITILSQLNPETTLFIVASKSFTTPETLKNAIHAKEWMGNVDHSQHFIAVTANTEAALKLGIKHVLPIWDWIGGRFSTCSAVNLITAIAIGKNLFSEFLNGAYVMDQHFQHTEFHQNLPVIFALTGIWNINFLQNNTLLILTYSRLLESIVSYLQQLDMESNGKSTDLQGNRVDYATAPIVWGGLGNQAQHSYFQLLCEGTHPITIDFLTINDKQHSEMNDFCKAKMAILKSNTQHDCKRPVITFNHLMLSECTPTTLGALISLFEHKIYVQSVIWNINSFDQPGVERAKQYNYLISDNV